MYVVRMRPCLGESPRRATLGAGAVRIDERRERLPWFIEVVARPTPT
jgi:hypothetical protein